MKSDKWETPVKTRTQLSAGKKLVFAISVIVGFFGAVEGACRLVSESRVPDLDGRIGYWEEWESRNEKGLWQWRGPTANSDGLRDREHWEANPFNHWRIVCLGDSVTWGHALKFSQAYPAMLERELRTKFDRVEVLNVSMPGWNLRHEAAAYKEIARKYAPDDVILGICLNDIPDLRSKDKASRLSLFLAPLCRYSAAARIVFNSQWREVGSVREMFDDPARERVEAAWEMAFDEILKLREAVVADGGQLHLVVFPYRWQVFPDAPEPMPQRRLAEFCKRHDLAFLDLLEPLERVGSPGFLDNNHFTSYGAQIVARAVAESGLLQLPADHNWPLEE